MTTSAANTASAQAANAFSRLVCGVDLSAAGVEATRQAASLVTDDGSLLLVAVAVGEPMAVASPAGLGATLARGAVDESTRARYRAALADAAREARAAFPQTRTTELEGDPVNGLLRTIGSERATLAVVGSHDYRRLPGVLLGSVATHLLHRAPCSVLITRGPAGRFGRILVGIDGSPESALALQVARALNARFGGELDTLAGYGGSAVHELDAAKRMTPTIETLDEPVHALVSRARPADLVVLGSRGLHGLRAIGSVSERVAHRAPCSVLVVRANGFQPDEVA
jgi:nucleotide-binding universal stress UspA family protein